MQILIVLLIVGILILGLVAAQLDRVANTMRGIHAELIKSNQDQDGTTDIR